MDPQRAYVLRTVEERGIRFIRLWFTDVQGFLKSFSITPAELQVALEEGLTFDGSVIEGFYDTGFVDEVLVVNNNAQEGTVAEVE